MPSKHSEADWKTLAYMLEGWRTNVESPDFIVMDVDDEPYSLAHLMAEVKQRTAFAKAYLQGWLDLRDMFGISLPVPPTKRN